MLQLPVANGSGRGWAWEKARGFCRDLMLVWAALWTFVAVEGAANNVAERALRPAVLWRKGCFGT